MCSHVVHAPLMFVVSENVCGVNVNICGNQDHGDGSGMTVLLQELDMTDD